MYNVVLTCQHRRNVVTVRKNNKIITTLLLNIKMFDHHNFRYFFVKIRHWLL